MSSCRKAVCEGWDIKKGVSENSTDSFWWLPAAERSWCKLGSEQHFISKSKGNPRTLLTSWVISDAIKLAVDLIQYFCPSWGRFYLVLSFKAFSFLEGLKKDINLTAFLWVCLDKTICRGDRSDSNAKCYLKLRNPKFQSLGPVRPWYSFFFLIRLKPQPCRQWLLVVFW